MVVTDDTWIKAAPEHLAIMIGELQLAMRDNIGVCVEAGQLLGIRTMLANPIGIDMAATPTRSMCYMWRYSPLCRGVPGARPRCRAESWDDDWSVSTWYMQRVEAYPT